MKQKCAQRSARRTGRGPTRRSARLVNVGKCGSAGEDKETEKEIQEEVPEDEVENLDEQTEADVGRGHEEEDQGDVEVLDEDMRCNICQAAFEKRGNFNRHMKKMHSEKEGGWPCEKTFCGEKFSTKYEMLVHKEECVFLCPNCDWSTVRGDRVEGHLRKHT